MGKGNLIGEPIKGIILKQIDNRQKMQGAGYNSESVKRDPEVLNYLNNRNAWIKMASGVAISGSAGIDKLRGIFAQSPDIVVTEEDISAFEDTGLAEKLVLFNTIQSVNDSKKQKPYISRSGIRKDNLFSNSLNKMYGGLGGNSEGLQPVGGITDFTVESLNRGSIRKATVNIKVYNKFQFNLVEILYLRLGYIMMLEWGWDKYVSKIEPTPGSPPEVTIEQMGSTIIEGSWFTKNTYTQQSMLREIGLKRLEMHGNYDAFFGKVSNFSWSVNQDGSYDIKVDLITLGSVIESINVRRPAIDVSTTSVPFIQEQLADKFGVEANNKGEYDNSLINNIGTNVLSQWLGQTIINTPDTNNYFNLQVSAQNLSFTLNTPKTQRYYIRLGHFLENLQDKIFPNINNGNCEPFKQVTIDNGEETNKCNYVLNLIPLDPGICIFDFKFSKEFEEKSYFSKSFTEDQSSIKNGNTVSTKGTRAFVAEKVDNNVVYGQLMNIYMNINFLQKELDSNLNDDGDLSLFQYLESICKGINRCTGGATNIEPAVKDDNSIYFLEQNPIKGFDIEKTVENTPPTNVDTAPIEILGYSSKGESNFVKDFSFNTKITPDLMNMISLGAAAEGDAASIPFNNWNEGLKNRFEEKSTKPIIDPDEQQYEGKDRYTGEGITPASEILLAFRQEMSTKGESDNVDVDGNGFFNFFGYEYNYDFTWKGHTIRYIGWDLNLTGDYKTDLDNDQFLQEVVDVVQAYEKSSINKIGPDRKLANSDLLSADNILKGINIAPGEEYLSYILSAFGGDTQQSTVNGDNVKQIQVPRKDSLWYKSITDNDFINRGISSFKKYINDININEYKNGNCQSSTSGFIPVELGLTVEGLSGMKIYNKISINQRFLPPAYPNALKFVIRGINHSVKGNLWETNIKTISTSITDQPPSTESNYYPSNQNNNSNISPITSYPELPLITPPPPPNLLPYKEAVKILNTITTPSIAKSVFAVLFAEASKNGQAFRSAGGYNYAGVQTDVNNNGRSIRWGEGSSKFIKARYVRKDAVRKREFAVFENDQSFLEFMVSRVISKGFNGNNGDSWTNTYINKWWSPADKAQYTKGTTKFNQKLAIYNSSQAKYKLYT
jgi:hypothetical protein